MVFYQNINPILLSLGPLQIRWYGIMYVLSFLFVYWYAKKCSREKKIKLSEEQIDNTMAWLTIAMIIGARIFDVLFWDLNYYAKHPLQILAIWQGGLSFHGGLLGIIIMSQIICKKYKINFLNFADTFVIPLALGQAFGRIGNFINGELYGFQTKMPWGVNFGHELDVLGNPVFRHPSQIYEALYDILIFTILWKLKDKKLTQGYIFATFLVLYSIFRSITELIRVQDVTFGQITMGQILNIPMFILGTFMLFKLNKKK